MAWAIFAVCSAVLVFAATKLAEYGDAIATHTGLGRMFVGTLLLAGATSLPELLTAINSLDQGVPDLAAGNFMGSNMFNMALLGVLDIAGRQARILRRVAMRHALTASLAVLMIGLTTFAMLADLDLHIGWVGADSLLIMLVYIVGLRLIQSNNSTAPEPEAAGTTEGMPGFAKSLVGFGLATLALVLVSPWLVRSSTEIAELTGLGAGFVGTTLVGVVTSLPEVATAIAAFRLGAYDLAVGNLFGSNCFNMFALALTDAFYTQGSFLGAISPEFALSALIGLALTSLALIGNIARVERRLLFVEADALLLLLGYAGGIWFLFQKGLGG